MANGRKRGSRPVEIVFLAGAVLCPLMAAAAAITIGASWRGSRATAPILNAIRSWIIFACGLLASIVFLLLRMQFLCGRSDSPDGQESDDD